MVANGAVTTGSARVTVTVYTFVVTPSSAATVTRMLLLPVDREIGDTAPYETPLLSAMVTLAPSSFGVALTVVDDTLCPTLAE